jgi:2-dehydro-3-deoxygluconokinase
MPESIRQPWAFPAHRRVVCLGESMVMLVPQGTGRLVDGHAFSAAVGGAESNVACYLARLGVDAAWMSRVGDDSFGRLVLDTVSGAGVDTSRVEVDPQRLTGCYVKEPDGVSTRVRYYRENSAASAMSPELAQAAGLGSAAVVHLSGITAALSPGCQELMTALTSAPRGDTQVSFDVNWRPVLWAGGNGPEVTAHLARRADLVFVGRDEAHALWGLEDTEGIAAYLGHPPALVVKDAEHGATLVDRAGTTWVPSLRVDVVEPVGAGDAFAAGFIAGTLAGLPAKQRLRLGHAVAACALSTPHDLGTLPDPDVLSALVHARDTEWRHQTMSHGSRS